MSQIIRYHGWRLPPRGSYIQEWRKHRELTLRGLEERIAQIDPDRALSFVSIGRIERGEQGWSRETLDIIAQALGVTPATLISEPPGCGDLVDAAVRMPHDRHAGARELLDLFAQLTPDEQARCRQMIELMLGHSGHKRQ